MRMEERLKKAAEAHQAGCNCCVSVLMGLSDLTGISEDTCSIGWCFGGGMQCGSVCGALTGGLMSVGVCLKGETPAEKRPAAHEPAIALEKAFEEKFGSMLCRDIVEKSGKRICPECIAFCTAAAGELIEKINKGEL